jgi:4-amino-4-deoxy-L-arabinose transferase-like glycosyltransferase
MKTNVGQKDAAVRYFIAALLIAIGAYLPKGNPISLPLIGVGIVLGLTAYFKFCGIYALFGFNTCPLDQKK